jgi:hypothetical protein
MVGFGAPGSTGGGDADCNGVRFKAVDMKEGIKGCETKTSILGDDFYFSRVSGGGGGGGGEKIYFTLLGIKFTKVKLIVGGVALFLALVLLIYIMVKLKQGLTYIFCCRCCKKEDNVNEHRSARDDYELMAGRWCGH